MTGSIRLIWPRGTSCNQSADVTAIIVTGPDLTEGNEAVTFDEVNFFFFLPAIPAFQQKEVLLCQIEVFQITLKVYRVYLPLCDQ